MTQPALTRRGFIAATVAALVAGPKAIEQVLLRAQIAAQMKHQAMLCMSSDPMHGIMQRAYRKMQAKALEGFQWQAEEWDAYTKVAETPSGFRAWSQRHPS